MLCDHSLKDKVFIILVEVVVVVVVHSAEQIFLLHCFKSGLCFSAEMCLFESGALSRGLWR